MRGRRRYPPSDPRSSRRVLEHRVSQRSTILQTVGRRLSIEFHMLADRRSTRNARVAVVALFAVGVALNVLIGQLVRNVLGLPIFLDSVGTILAGALAGPLAGAAVGVASNLLWG